MDMQFDYIAESEKTFNEVVCNLEAKIAEKGFRVVKIHDMQATFAEKGLQMEPNKIIEICNTKDAFAVLSSEPKLACMLPCRIGVYMKNGKTHTSMMLPSLIAMFVQNPVVAETAMYVEGVMKAIVNESV